MGHIADGGARGPGWGLGERTYAAGDRVLLHARFRDAGGALHNGSVGTVIAAGDDGALRARFGDREVVLPASFVAGLRDDATPNLSHAWARTVDGAQGGTWEAAHLLGTDALDAFRGYVGQSRSRVPTHTWNVRRTPAVDHGGVLADDRDGAAQVLAALGREPDVDFAAVDDPWPADRRLRAERAEHRQVLDRCPNDRPRELQAAVNRGHEAVLQLRFAEGDVERAVQALKELPHLGRLRAAGRAARGQAESRLNDATGALDRRRAEVAGAGHRVAELRATNAIGRSSLLGRAGGRRESSPSTTSSPATGPRWSWPPSARTIRSPSASTASGRRGSPTAPSSAASSGHCHPTGPTPWSGPRSRPHGQGAPWPRRGPRRPTPPPRSTTLAVVTGAGVTATPSRPLPGGPSRPRPGSRPRSTTRAVPAAS